MSEFSKLSIRTLLEDETAYEAFLNIEGYTPIQATYSKEALQATYRTMKDAQMNETQLMASLKTAKDATTKAERTFHDAVLGMKQQVIAQYGSDSDEVQQVGLKKKSKRATPARNNTPPTT